MERKKTRKGKRAIDISPVVFYRDNKTGKFIASVDGAKHEVVVYGEEVTVDVGQSSRPKTNSLVRGEIRRPRD